MADTTIEPYRPSSGEEGAYFMRMWCARCKRDAAYRAYAGDSCPIANAALAFDIDDPEYPVEWVDDIEGPSNPRCTAFEAEEPTP